MTTQNVIEEQISPRILEALFANFPNSENRILPVEIQANRLDLTIRRRIAGGTL